MWEVFKSFFILGLMSFGGPVAHIGYFHRMFVQDKSWLSEQEFASLVALSQMLPGPGSSQVCFAIGLQRAGILGALLAFIAFTLPSFFLMVIFAYSYAVITDNAVVMAIISVLKLVAVVVVADAVYSMFTNFCKTTVTRTICILTASALLLFSIPLIQILSIFIAALIGWHYCKVEENEKKEIQTGSIFTVWFWLFCGLFALSFLSSEVPVVNLFNQYFQAGSLVFGGGHVVLPLLQTTTADTVSSETFLAGYAAAQGIPGPMFTFATFLGFFELTTQPFLGAMIATLAIFLPGFLLILAFLPHWQRISSNQRVVAIVIGINASVVGLLIAALYQPIFTSAVASSVEFAFVLVGLFLLKVLNWSIMRILLIAVASAALATFI